MGRKQEKARVRAIFQDLTDNEVFDEYHKYENSSQYTKEVLQELDKWNALKSKKAIGR